MHCGGRAGRFSVIKEATYLAGVKWVSFCETMPVAIRPPASKLKGDPMATQRGFPISPVPRSECLRSSKW